MTLKEQFKKEIIAAPVMDEVIDYWVSELEQVADEYAIEFADWLIKRQTKYFESLKELLEIFKKEKELL